MSDAAPSEQTADDLYVFLAGSPRDEKRAEKARRMIKAVAGYDPVAWPATRVSQTQVSKVMLMWFTME